MALCAASFWEQAQERAKLWEQAEQRLTRRTTLLFTASEAFQHHLWDQLAQLHARARVLELWLAPLEERKATEDLTRQDPLPGGIDMTASDSPE